MAKKKTAECFCGNAEGSHKIRSTRADRCQCVMCHCGALLDGTIHQCPAERSPYSNLFCEGCEEMHGEVFREKYGGGTSI